MQCNTVPSAYSLSLSPSLSCWTKKKTFCILLLAYCLTRPSTPFHSSIHPHSIMFSMRSFVCSVGSSITFMNCGKCTITFHVREENRMRLDYIDRCDCSWWLRFTPCALSVHRISCRVMSNTPKSTKNIGKCAATCYLCGLSRRDSARFAVIYVCCDCCRSA